MGITDESKERLKAEADIVDIVSEVVELKKYGGNYKGLCPFHSEKTPSFVVSPAKQIYHCFGCKAGGDVFKFVQEVHQLSFPEAVEYVADRVGFTLEYDGGGRDRVDYRRVMDLIQGYYVSKLREKDIDYLKGRGVHKRTIRKWGIGYAPRSPEQIRWMESQLLPADQLLDLRIVRDGERGRYVTISDRITFPIHDHAGRVVGWSGRSTRDGVKAKYINSAESRIFDKSSVLYGWHIAKDSIYKRRAAIVMEGQMDVILSHQAGISTAVATMGTALTGKHLSLIRRASARVILVYDGDQAGVDAAEKVARMVSASGMAGGVVILPGGDDPAEMVASGRAEELKQMILSSVDLPRYVLGRIAARADLGDPYGRAQAVRESREYIGTLGDPVLMQEYASVAASLCGVRPEDVSVTSPSAASAHAAMTLARSSDLSILLTLCT